MKKEKEEYRGRGEETLLEKGFPPPSPEPPPLSFLRLLRGGEARLKGVSSVIRQQPPEKAWFDVSISLRSLNRPIDEVLLWSVTGYFHHN
ncbi:hypothetical protein, partial [uncultured Bilophila sp.]|uniref:hypothetical protein n=1 Tax=uncultured Bilophila sp. TaxID=529385 RepID=UPI00266F58AB